MPQFSQKTYEFFANEIQQLLNISYKDQVKEKYLSEYPVDLILDFIYDQKHNIDNRKMACMILKLKMSHRQKCMQEKVDADKVLGRIQVLYMINSTNNKELFRLQNAIEIVIEAIFEHHFDDSKKITLFQQIAQQLHKYPLSKQQKHLSFLLMIVNSLYYLSVNNQMLIGQMVLYLGEILDLLETKYHNYQNQNQKDNDAIQEIYQILIQTVDLMKQIKQKVDRDNQEEQNVVAEFMANSTQLRTHFIRILKLKTIEEYNQNTKTQDKIQINCIWKSNQRFNKLKADVLNLWQQVWQYYAQIDLLELLMTSVLTIPKNKVVDQVESIISSCLILLQRSCTHREYAQIFFKITQNLTVKLFQLVSINQSQYSLIQTDSDYFIEINDDFCKQQEMETMKTRAGSLIANLTLAIDGYLTFVTQFALLALRQLQTKEQKSPQQLSVWKSFIGSWGCTQQQLIQTSILILSSISDQISKRKDLMTAVISHLQRMIPYFSQESQLSHKPLFILRYMQMYAFFSFPSCLDHFIRNFTKQPIYQRQISKSFEVIMRYYDKKNPAMEKYIKEIGNSIMLLGDQLTPLLQQQIMQNNNIIKNFKENVLQKLVIWFLDAYKKQEVLQINKLSTLIIRLFHDNSKSQINEYKNLKPFDRQFLYNYLSEIYKNIFTCSEHPCQQAIIQICISNIEYLYDAQQITVDDCYQFFQIGKIVTERNKISLNNCLMLFNSLICPDIPINRKSAYKQFKFDQITFQLTLKILQQISQWIHLLSQQIGNSGQNKNYQNKNVQNDENSNFREEDVWQILQLTQISLFSLQSYHNQNSQKIYDRNLFWTFSSKILQFCLFLIQKCQSSTLKTKVMMVILQIVSVFPQNTQIYGFLNNIQLPNPCDFPAFECRKYAYYLMRIMKTYMVHLIQELRIHILKVIIDLVYFLQNERQNMKNYDQKLYITGDGVALNASQKRNKVYSAFDFRISFNVHDQFRQLIKNYPEKKQLLFLNQEKKYEGKIKDLVDKMIVNQKTRKLITVKRQL